MNSDDPFTPPDHDGDSSVPDPDAERDPDRSLSWGDGVVEVRDALEAISGSPIETADLFSRVSQVVGSGAAQVAPGYVFYPDMPPELAGEFDATGFAPLGRPVGTSQAMSATSRPPARRRFAAWVITALAFALLVPFIWVVSTAAIAQFIEPGQPPERDRAAVSSPLPRPDVSALTEAAPATAPVPQRFDEGLRGSAAEGATAGSGVVLALRLGDRWVEEARGVVDARGQYEVEWIPWAGEHQMRVVDAAGRWSTPAVEVIEVGAERDSGSATDYSLLGGRWDPCQPIEWGYAPEGGYLGAEDDVAASLARIAYATGLRFTFVGDVDADEAARFAFADDSDGDVASLTQVDPAMGTPGDGVADLVVRWATPTQVPALAGETLGIAGPLRSRVSDEPGPEQYVAGVVILDASEIGADASSAPGAVWTWPSVMTHEFAHAVGLGHAAGASELMAPAARGGNNVIGPGDAAGLALLGAASGCLT